MQPYTQTVFSLVQKSLNLQQLRNQIEDLRKDAVKTQKLLLNGRGGSNSQNGGNQQRSLASYGRMFAQATKACLKQLTQKAHSKHIIIFSSQVANVKDDNTEQVPLVTNQR